MHVYYLFTNFRRKVNKNVAIPITFAIAIHALKGSIWWNSESSNGSFFSEVSVVSVSIIVNLKHETFKFIILKHIIIFCENGDVFGPIKKYSFDKIVKNYFIFIRDIMIILFFVKNRKASNLRTYQRTLDLIVQDLQTHTCLRFLNCF